MDKQIKPVLACPYCHSDEIEDGTIDAACRRFVCINCQARGMAVSPGDELMWSNGRSVRAYHAAVDDMPARYERD